MKNGKPSYTATSRYFANSRPVEVEVRTRFEAPQPRRRAMRLSFDGVHERYNWTEGRLKSELDRAVPADSILFPDTGFMKTELDWKLWEAFCQRRIELVPAVIGELQPWVNEPWRNKYVAWMVQKSLSLGNDVDEKIRELRINSRIGLQPAEWQPYAFVFPKAGGSSPIGAYQHYLDLIVLRKLFGKHVADEMKSRSGAVPTSSQLKNELNKLVGDRGAQIAFKGWEKFGAMNFTADEELVVQAVLTAIVTGRDTVILTWDTDLQEQFVRLMYHLCADYSCWAFGEYYAAHPEMPLFDLAVDESLFFASSMTNKNLKHVKMPTRDSDIFWPTTWTPVGCHCLLLGNHRKELKVTPTTFYAEREMHHLLEVIHKTGGRNSERFGESNIIVGSGKMDDGRSSTMYCIADETYTEIYGRKVTTLNWIMTRLYRETMRRKLFPVA